MPRIQWDPKITLGNVLTVITMLGVLLAGYVNLKLDVQASTTAIAAVRVQVEPVDDFNLRLSKVEINQTNGRAERLQQQEDLREALKEAQTATNKRLDKMDDTLLELAKAVSGLTATLKAIDPKS